jgi:hypothetical protein
MKIEGGKAITIFVTNFCLPNLQGCFENYSLFQLFFFTSRITSVSVHSMGVRNMGEHCISVHGMK